MLVSGEYAFPAPRAQVWRLLHDERVLARCTPGCQGLTRVGPGRFTATLKVGPAAVQGIYAAELQLVDVTEPEAMTLKIEAKGGTGFVSVQGRMDLLADGQGTKLLYRWDVKIGGAIAMVGQRVLAGVARGVVGDFFAAVGRELPAGAAS